MKQFVLDYLRRACDTTERITRCQLSVADADLTLDLQSGQTVAIYIVNRAIRIPEIRETYEHNTRQRLYTLYLIDGRMMPEEETSVEPPGWLNALHTVQHGRVYAYWCKGRAVTIRPVHLDWKWGTTPRHVEYGPPVQLKDIRPFVAEVASKQIDGRFTSADFNEGAFWKRQDPSGYQPHKYSWRSWQMNGKKKEAPPNPDTAWEEFFRHYGDIGGTNAYRTYANFQQRQTRGSASSQERPRQRVKTTYRRDYAILGVSDSATYEEVRRAYRNKARENHPDMHPNEKEKYTARMADINAAFEAIKRRLNET